MGASNWLRRIRARSEAPAEPIACDLGALGAGERREHARTARALFTAVEEVAETKDGYAFRLPEGSEALVRAAGFVARERRCCPFLRFALVAEPRGGAVWLELGGSERVKRHVREGLVARWERERAALGHPEPAAPR